MASEAVKQGKAFIQDGYEFYKWAHENEKSVCALFYSQVDYDSASQSLADMETKVVPGTMKLHAVYSPSRGVILTRSVSCYCSGCLDGTDLCNGWIEQKRMSSSAAVVVCATSRSSPPSSATGSSSSAADSSSSAAGSSTPAAGSSTSAAGSSSSDAGQSPSAADAMSSATTPSSSSSSVAINDQSNVKEDALIAAVYDGDWYVGRVLEMEKADTAEAFVTFMTKHYSKGQLTLRWPERPDELLIQLSNIIRIIDEPLPVGRSKRYYQLSDADLNALKETDTLY
ncbi:hypothetical protein SNE40_010769 [Patella caerulea]|uniref:Tudor domain-containing protein n=1 Tax=Patella caerulea TaxID=87958 RepID=A0AAN8JYW7_PATCE